MPAGRLTLVPPRDAAPLERTERPPPGTGGLQVRRMRPEDAPRVASLTLAAYDAYGSISGPYRAALADPLRRAAGATAVLVAALDDEVVGTITDVRPADAEWEGRPTPEGDCGFRVLAVAPNVEARGVGRLLVTTCLDRARNEGCRRAVITSMAWMTRAHRLYTGLGFTRRADLDVRFPGGDGYVFTLDLTPDAPVHFPPPGPVPQQPPWFEDVWQH